MVLAVLFGRCLCTGGYFLPDRLSAHDGEVDGHLPPPSGVLALRGGLVRGGFGLFRRRLSGFPLAGRGQSAPGLHPRVVQLLRRFKWAMAGAAASLCLILPQFFVAADQEDAPGLFVIGCGIVAVPFVVAVFLAVLQRLWQTALTYKEENDLTV